MKRRGCFSARFRRVMQVRGRKIPFDLVKERILLKRFSRDQSGSYVIISALLMPVLVGATCLGTEAGLWLYTHKNLLSAADSAAVSAATAGSNLTAEANAVTASHGYVNGANGVTVTVKQPPSSGSYASNSGAVEVVIRRTQPRLLSALFDSNPIIISARAVAVRSGGAGCVFALNSSANPSVAVKGSVQLNLIKCGLYANSSASSALTVSGTAALSASQVSVVGGITGTNSITAPGGIIVGASAIADPYQNIALPRLTGCDYGSKITVQSITTLYPGVYCGDIKINAGASLTLTPGIYYLDRSSLSMQGNATIVGSGVTLVFTSSTSTDWGVASIGSNANISLTAPTSGKTAGIVLFGDRNMPPGIAFSLAGGGTQNIGGAIYLPKAALSFSGGNGTITTCTQIIADTITFVGNTNVQVDCSFYGTKSIGTTTAQLVE